MQICGKIGLTTGLFVALTMLVGCSGIGNANSGSDSQDSQRIPVSALFPIPNCLTGVGLLSGLSTANDSTFLLDTASYTVENANEPWSLSSPDCQTLEFQVNPGDSWVDAPSARSEIASPVFANGVPINISYNLVIQPGDPIPTGMGWVMLGEFHYDDKAVPAPISTIPPLSIQLISDTAGKEYMAVLLQYQKAGDLVATSIEVYHDFTPIQRGKAYAMKIQVTFDNAGGGQLNVWRDGIQLVNYSGSIGYGMGNYWRAGIYEGNPNQVNFTLAVDYNSMSVQ